MITENVIISIVVVSGFLLAIVAICTAVLTYKAMEDEQEQR